MEKDKENNHATYIIDFINKFCEQKDKPITIFLKHLFCEDIKKGNREHKNYGIIGKYLEYVKKEIKNPENKKIFGDIKEKEAQEFLEKIENHIVRHIYKYVYPTKKSSNDYKFLKLTQSLDWIQPEHLDIKKLYVNQLKFAEKSMKRIDEEKSVIDKLECIHNAYIAMNNTVKFISGKNEDAGQDELTPLFQYVLIKSRPSFLFTNIFYIKSILSEADLIGPKGFYVSQMESAADFINQINNDTFKMSKEDFDRKKQECLRKYNENIDNENKTEISKKT